MPRGRPTKKTPSSTERIIAAIRLGATYVLAAQAGGISYDTLRDWLKRGDAGEEGFVDFSEAVRRAEIECLNEMLESIRRGAKRDWRAADSFISRRWPSEFGARSKLELSGDPERPVVPTIINVIAPRSTTEDGDTNAA